MGEGRFVAEIRIRWSPTNERKALARMATAQALANEVLAEYLRRAEAYRRDLLVAETGGYPFFIQEYASMVWMFTEGATIGVRDIEGRIAGIRTDLDEQFYAPRFARLTERE